MTFMDKKALRGFYEQVSMEIHVMAKRAFKPFIGRKALENIPYSENLSTDLPRRLFLNGTPMKRVL